MAATAAEALPKGMKFEWTDLTYQKILAGNTAVLVFPLSILLVFLVLAAQYESFRLPLAVVLIVPLTLLAAMAGVMIKGGDNNVFTQIGLIVLIGLAAKNAILIVEFAKAKQDEGDEPARAAVEAAKLRLRPILMTSIAFIAGVSPLVTSHGAGSEMRQAMGVAVFSGMIGVTLFGLLLTPVFYTVLMRFGRKRAAAVSRDATPIPALATSLALIGASTLLLNACTVVGPDYARPDVPVPAAYRDAPTTPGVEWQQASPADQTPRGEWWRIFGDETLNDLEARAAAGNQDLKGALARIEEARAIVRATNADRLPSATFDPELDRTRYSPNAGVPFPVVIANDIRVPLNATWEIDLWGRVQRSVESAERDSEAEIANFESLRLVLHADVAAGFFTLRALDLERGTLERTVGLRNEALDLLRARLSAGNATDLDVARAEAELGSAESDLAAVTRARSEVQSSLAVLLGEPASSFEIPPIAAGQAEPPVVPTGLPGELLERRPDVARAERQLAARNARIGVAKAAFFPTVRLTGYAGFESKELNDLFDLESSIWSIGPSVSLPIFQGGRNQANLRRSREAFEEGVAAYRQSVLVAFKEVQDALTATRLLADQSAAVGRTAQSSRRASELARKRFEAGYVGYIDVIDSQRTELSAERGAAQVEGLRFVTAVQLVKALGGGWSSETSLPPLVSR
jgi:multidrug efflux system outer membrane protein